MKKFILLLSCLLPIITAMAQYATDIVPAPPNPPKLVNDYIGLLTPDQKATLEQKLVAFDDSTSNQIVVVITNTIGDLEPVEYCVALGRKWGVGNKNFNNGVIVLVVKDDERNKRKVFIAPGYGLEGALPDITCNQIVQFDMVPALKSGNYYRALDEATSSIVQAIGGEYKAPEGYQNRGKGRDGLPVGLVIFIVVIVLLIISRGGGGRGGMMSRRGYRGFNGPVIWPGSGWPSSGGGGWSGGGSSGGFGGFGGGSFGGGGAGGDW